MRPRWAMPIPEFEQARRKRGRVENRFGKEDTGGSRPCRVVCGCYGRRGKRGRIGHRFGKEDKGRLRPRQEFRVEISKTNYVFARLSL